MQEKKKKNVRAALIKAGISQKDIDEVIATAITSKNYNTTFKEIYGAALKEDQRMQDRQLEKRNKVKQEIYNSLSQCLANQREIYKKTLTDQDFSIYSGAISKIETEIAHLSLGK